MHDSQAPSTISKKQWNSLYIKKLMNKPIPNSPIHNDVFVGDENQCLSKLPHTKGIWRRLLAVPVSTLFAYHVRLLNL